MTAQTFLFKSAFILKIDIRKFHFVQKFRSVQLFKCKRACLKQPFNPRTYRYQKTVSDPQTILDLLQTLRAYEHDHQIFFQILWSFYCLSNCPKFCALCFLLIRFPSYSWRFLPKHWSTDEGLPLADNWAWNWKTHVKKPNIYQATIFIIICISFFSSPWSSSLAISFLTCLPIVFHMSLALSPPPLSFPPSSPLSFRCLKKSVTSRSLGLAAGFRLKRRKKRTPACGKPLVSSWATLLTRIWRAPR